ncbi:MAG: hypothetical protein LBT35_03700 [Tannerella sp.]|jgi:hypothetical protein|nr:hypothetical protein [Tannerella sp.]
MESLLGQKEVVRRKGRVWRKIRNTIFLVLVLGLGIGGYLRYYYPFASGVKSGKLNYVVYKGFVFKTYEGKLIQSGIKTSAGGGIQSNEFEFSVSGKEIAEKLMHAGGKTVELHYIEYFASVPWRGYSKYVVNKIESISEDKGDAEKDDEDVNL